MKRDPGLAEQIAAALRAESPLRHDPVHLHSIALGLGVSDIQIRPLAADGQVLWTQGVPAITIRNDMTPARRRFTLAHELAHVILGHGMLAHDGVRHRSATESPRLSRARVEEERLCDSVAAALLMPRHLVSNLVGGGLTMSRFLGFAEGMQVSRSALVYRIADVSPRLCMLIDLDQDSDGSWTLVRITGRKPWPKEVAVTLREITGGVFSGNPATESDLADLRFDCGNFGLVLSGESVRSVRGHCMTASVLILSARRALST